MRRLGLVMAIPGLALALSACNTTDALTPQVDVGHSNVQSTPVNQGDLDQMAAAADRSPSGVSSQIPAYAPQNTRQAQAQAMSSGAQYGEPVAAQQPAPAQPQTRTAALPSGSSSGTIRFLPIIGAPVQAVTPLSRQLGAEARAKGLTIRPSSDTSAENILKGYLSAFADGGNVTIVYVWDILDANGARLHRLQGQETVPARGSDPWAGVTDTAMQKIAAKTLTDYQSWKQAHSG
ncbi:hypothetical protein [Agrobacterium rubi]|uniref:Lipoprotein n=1 Tax=Agrobacterium rubi TaxID=28099 RepID=A0AAE7R4Q0_9HYPH|nr:hypothetical protein [Agrobacterium rubi]NTF02876.1 hypothetical protein [Agrobacterium rubi]NTF37120.1 hypothetical protein [Agrobacterium rubi]OCJ55294.1 hypothetical protein A6U92_01410 [Agrobacterium rubi]QTF99551.1 hypothetical protein G6M88_03650 [Agrobacterium rubi]